MTSANARVGVDGIDNLSGVDNRPGVADDLPEVAKFLISQAAARPIVKTDCQRKCQPLVERARSRQITRAGSDANGWGGRVAAMPTDTDTDTSSSSESGSDAESEVDEAPAKGALFRSYLKFTVSQDSQNQSFLSPSQFARLDLYQI